MLMRILLKKKTRLDVSVVGSRCCNWKTSSTTSFSRGGGGGGGGGGDGGVLMSVEDYGALGLRSSSSIMAAGGGTYEEPIQIPGLLLPCAMRIGDAHYHSLAVTVGGEVGAWGRNNVTTQLGRGSSHCPRVSLLRSSCAGETVSSPSLLTKMASHNSTLMRIHARYMSNASVTLKVDNDVVRFSFDKFQPDNKVAQSNGKKRHKKVKMSKKAKVNELRMYRLKAKKKITSPNPEVRIRYKLEKAKRKETWLIEKLRKFEVRKLPAETYDPEILTEEEKFYLKRTGEKKKNYVPVGRRGVFGGVVLNMHLHWKKHETVKVICKPCKPGQVHEYAEELTRLSKGIVIDIKANDTIIFYRGKNYVQPEVMSPPDTLSKNKALEKYQYEQSLEHTSLFIEKLEKELEEYHKHIALYRKRKEAASEEHSTPNI